MLPIHPTTASVPLLTRIAKNRYAWLSLLVVGGLVAGVVGRWDRATGSPTRIDAAPLPVRAARIDSIVMEPMKVSYPGLIIARKESELGFERPGRVMRILKEEGDAVVTGEVMAELDTEDLDASEDRASAELRSAEAVLRELVAGPRKQEIRAAAARVEQRLAEIALANANLEREKTLLRKGAGSQRTLDTAKYALQVLEEQIRSSRADLELLEEGTRTEQIDAQQAACESIRAQLKEIAAKRQDSRILAPFDGRVTTRRFDEGAVIAAGMPIIGLISHELEARFGLPADMASSLSIGQAIDVSVEQHHQTAAVDRLEPNVDLTTRTRAVYLRFNDVDPSSAASDRIIASHWIAGQVANVHLPQTLQPLSKGDTSAGGPNREEYWVPTSALTSAGRGIWSVLVLPQPSATVGLPDAEGTCERRAVEVVRTEGGHSLVRGMIQGSDLLIMDGLHRITAGMRVKVLNTEAS